MAETLFFQIVLIATVSVFAQWLAWRLHIPAILFLLGFGFLFGPVFGIIQPDALFGDLLQPAISAAVAIILFEGSLHLKLRELRQTRKSVRRLIALGAPLTWLLGSLAAFWVAGLEWAVSVVLGGILVVTGPTVIMPMLRQTRLNMNASSVLKWEGIVNDPLGVIFAVLAYEFFVASRLSPAPLDSGFFFEKGAILLIVAFASFALAHLLTRLFERGHVPEYLKAPFLLAALLALFFSANTLLHESGLIAVTILGMTLANIHRASFEEIRRFKETITLLLVSGVFLVLTARLDMAVLDGMSWRHMAFIVVLMFIVRPLSVIASCVGTEITWRERLLIGWIAPRGIVCAAMAGLLGPLLTSAGFEDGDKILPVAFAVVVATVVVHSLTIRPLARSLSLRATEAGGIVVVGAHPWTIQMAEVLKERSVPVMIVDNNYHALTQARLADIPVYYGEILSEETEYALELHKYGTLIAATDNPAYNALVCEKFAYDFGQDRVFLTSPHDEREDKSEYKKIAPAIIGRYWGKKHLTLERLNILALQGWRFKVTRVGKDKQTGKLILPEESERRYLMGLISKGGTVHFSSPLGKETLQPKEDDIVLLFDHVDTSQKARDRT